MNEISQFATYIMDSQILFLQIACLYFCAFVYILNKKVFANFGFDSVSRHKTRLVWTYIVVCLIAGRFMMVEMAYVSSGWIAGFFAVLMHSSLYFNLQANGGLLGRSDVSNFLRILLICVSIIVAVSQTAALACLCGNLIYASLGFWMHYDNRSIHFFEIQQLLAAKANRLSLQKDESFSKRWDKTA